MDTWFIINEVMCTNRVNEAITEVFKMEGYMSFPKDRVLILRSTTGFDKMVMLQFSGGKNEVLAVLSAGIYNERIAAIANRIWPKWWRPTTSALSANYTAIAHFQGLEDGGWIFDCSAPSEFQGGAQRVFNAYESVCLPWLRKCSTMEDFIEVSSDVRLGLAAYSRVMAYALIGQWRDGIQWGRSLSQYHRFPEYKQFVDDAEAYFVDGTAGQKPRNVG